MLIKEPFFLTNETWYNYDIKSMRYVLTEKAPPKAVESYKEYYKLWETLANPELDL